MALSWTLDKIGVLAHTAEDCGLVLRQIAGKDESDPATSGKSFYYVPKYYRESIRQWRVGYAEIDWSEWPEEPLRPVLAGALRVIKTLGATMQETRLPDFQYGVVIGTIIDSEAASIFEPLIRSAQLQELADRGQIDGLEASLSYSALDYLKAMRVRTQIMAAMRQLFSEVDLLVAPTHFELPERSDRPFPEDTPPKQFAQGVGHGLTQAGNLCGYPAVAIPCGFVNGLPIGLQIVGPAFSENRILAFAQEFQAQTDFHRQHPPVAD
jgi:aspartyl-tRNA(Asn)/glutamyl-tRNA(Gln) amidotransferase subunit A